MRISEVKLEANYGMQSSELQFAASFKAQTSKVRLVGRPALLQISRLLFGQRPFLMRTLAGAMRSPRRPQPPSPSRSFMRRRVN